MEHRFGILGALEAPGTVPRGRVSALLALLLVARGSAVPLRRVADELWDGTGPQHPRNAVQVVVSRLRDALGAEAVVSRPDGYALPLAPGELDAERFEAGAARGRRRLARGDHWAAAEILSTALGLWRGPALADVAEYGFAHPETARLERLRLACTSDRLDADMACGRHGDAAAELEALVGEHPLDERLRGQLMLALYHCGHQAQALGIYREAYRAFVDRLGIEPSPRLRAVEAAILAHRVPPAA